MSSSYPLPVGAATEEQTAALRVQLRFFGAVVRCSAAIFLRVFRRPFLHCSSLHAVSATRRRNLKNDTNTKF